MVKFLRFPEVTSSRLRKTRLTLPHVPGRGFRGHATRAFVPRPHGHAKQKPPVFRPAFQQSKTRDRNLPSNTQAREESPQKHAIAISSMEFFLSSRGRTPCPQPPFTPILGGMRKIFHLGAEKFHAEGQRGGGAEDLEGEISHAEVRRRGEKETERLDCSGSFAFLPEGRIWKTDRTKGTNSKGKLACGRL